MGKFGGQNTAGFIVGKTSDFTYLLLTICLPVCSWQQPAAGLLLALVNWRGIRQWMSWQVSLLLSSGQVWARWAVKPGLWQNCAHFMLTALRWLLTFLWALLRNLPLQTYTPFGDGIYLCNDVFLPWNWSLFGMWEVLRVLYQPC